MQISAISTDENTVVDQSVRRQILFAVDAVLVEWVRHLVFQELGNLRRLWEITSLEEVHLRHWW